MMKPPRSFRVMGQKFTVQTMAHLVKAGAGPEDEDTELLGDTDRSNQIIRLASHVSDDKAREVYLHEALHTMTGLTGLTRGALSFEEEEDLVNRLAPVVLQFLRDNPNVYAYLTGRWVGGRGSAY